MSITRQLATMLLKGRIRVVTGLHIGAGSDTIEIGGMDNPIIRRPDTGEPYVPGSSIKGKMRSLIEWHLVPERMIDGSGRRKPGDPCTCGRMDCPSCVVFGVSANGGEAEAIERGPTRIAVRDAFLTDKWRSEFGRGERDLVEAKNENSINRVTAAANPRPIERVVPDVEFDLEIAYRVFDRDGDAGAFDRDLFNRVVLKGLALIESDSLGGGGSRGNGRVRFVDLTVDGESVSLPEL